MTPKRRHPLNRDRVLRAAIKLAANIIGFVSPSTWTVLDAVDALGSLGLLFVGGYALARGIAWAKRRLLWRVRRKLILSYVFVGLVPGLLIIAFGILQAWVMNRPVVVEVLVEKRAEVAPHPLVLIRVHDFHAARDSRASELQVEAVRE